jgi:Uma2 family endonuclease
MDSPSEYQQDHVYTLKTPNLIIEGVAVNSFHYKPNLSYSIETFEAINDWLKTNTLEIDGTPVNGFEHDSKGRLIPMPPVPLGKEIAVLEIGRQLSNWNLFSAQPGAVSSSQGGFLIGPGMIKAPDVAFTPSGICSTLTQNQQFSFRGAPFCPIFVVELDDLTIERKLVDLTAKIEDSYFPSGVQLAWLVDPVNKIFYVFKRTKAGVIRRCLHPWYKNDQPAVIKGGNVLPGFELQLSKIDKVYTVVRSFYPITSLSNLYGPVSAKCTCARCRPECSIPLLALRPSLYRVCSYNAS